MKRVVRHYFCLILFLLVSFFSCKKDTSKAKPTTLIKGKETVKSVTQKLQDSVLKRLKTSFEKHNLVTLPKKLLFLIFKEEQRFEVYFLKNGAYYLLKQYPFTNFSGRLGPKLQQGDRQIPEGIYRISYLNPNSSYHLSLKVSYPNAFDKKKGKLENRSRLGGDIFIHGKNLTIGCVPLGDLAIEEVFLLASNSINLGIDVVISPRDFRKNMKYPSISSVTWEKELYENIENELKKYTYK